MKKIILLALFFPIFSFGNSNALHEVGRKIGKPITDQVLRENPSLISNPKLLERVVYQRMAEQVHLYQSEIEEALYQSCMSENANQSSCSCYVVSWSNATPSFVDYLQAIFEVMAEGTPESTMRLVGLAQQTEVEDANKKSGCGL